MKQRVLLGSNTLDIFCSAKCNIQFVEQNSRQRISQTNRFRTDDVTDAPPPPPLAVTPAGGGGRGRGEWAGQLQTPGPALPRLRPAGRGRGGRAAPRGQADAGREQARASNEG